jgi:hypothetical protein
LRPGQDLSWSLILSSNAADYGGEEQASFDPEKEKFLLTEPEVAVFVEHHRNCNS